MRRVAIDVDRVHFPVTPAGQLNETSGTPACCQIRFADATFFAIVAARPLVAGGLSKSS